MANDYSALDAEILTAIGAGPTAYAAICATTTVRAIADAIVHPGRYISRDTAIAQVIDRRLQALRKAGTLSYSTKPRGWSPA